MKFLRSLDRSLKKEICIRLFENHSSLANNAVFERSISHYVNNDDYMCFFVTPDTGGIYEAFCYGIAKLYMTPLIEKHLIGIEAIYSNNENLEAFVLALSCIADLAAEMKLFGVHLSENSINDEINIETVLNIKHIKDYPLRFEEILMQGAVAGVYSAFIEKPTNSAFLSRGIMLHTFRVEMTFEGEVTQLKELYRGEGRLENSPRWTVNNYRELANYFLKEGFAARANGRFHGTLPEQILQQGYVDQPTVSLTSSAKVAAYYGTRGWKRDFAVVFTIDMEKLSEIGNSYDSYKTMQKYCDWMLSSSFEIILKIVKHLNVQIGGEFLDKLDKEAMRRVHSYGGGSSFGESIDWRQFLGKDNYNILLDVGLRDGDFEQIQDEFETLWMITEGGGLFADNIQLNKEGEVGETTETLFKPTYHRAFELVKSILEDALISNDEYGQPGWDLSPFGYIAKTIRDKEFFSPASIPGYCVKRATIIDSNEKVHEIINRGKPPAMPGRHAEFDNSGNRM